MDRLREFLRWTCRTGELSHRDVEAGLVYAGRTIAAFFALLAVLYVPFLQWVFRTEPITPAEWGRVLMVALSVTLVVEIDKLIRNRRSGAAQEWTFAIG